MHYTISATALLAVIIFLRLRRRTEARSRNDETVTVLSAATLGILIAATPLGEAVLQLVNAATNATH
ncbi:MULTISPECIES: hypothetical protein [unclassified Kitasatospora]|uniref:hypothetical protein n=1 Tax=unclassified Kitasatospora TaxID=2633591 RepID=UPI00070DB773|nr:MULTISPECIES: hypothetical protein [unclassified Kitasatospora]KQV14285.1 hypothetical protein ASC99_31965 [Kitasatospora sp. Root107]KRB72381.1 hypothetical protein ASE03_22940 [Kitasatospora sp. Root187]